MEFTCYGNAQIEGTNKHFFEIIQAASVIPKGDCVVGTRANYDAEAIKALLQVANKLRIILKTKDWEEVVNALPNKSFLPGPELVIRKTDQTTPGTIAINADKAAADFSKEFVEAIKKPEEQITVKIERA